jgi:hypothetical protein
MKYAPVTVYPTRILTQGAISALHILDFGLLCLRNYRMKDEDLRIELLEDGGREITLTITHIPTGTTVSGKGKRRFVLKNKLLEKLQNLIQE